MDAIVPLVQNLIKLGYEDIPPQVLGATKKSIVDTFAALLAGTSAQGCPEVIAQALEWGGKEEGTIFHYGKKVPAFLAALANGMMARAVDFDDVFEPGTMHASASIVPAALAAAEMKGGLSGKQFLAAVTLGIDMICRMGRTNKIPSGLSGMNVTFQYACFGCAGVVGRILGLDEEKMVHAMGLAYTQTAGNSQNLLEGTLATRFSQGLAAQSGVYAAIFARRGITAAREVLEGKFGYYRVYQRGEYDVRNLLDGLGKRFEGVNVTLKKYPCCMHSHAAIDALLDISGEQDLHWEEVERVTVKINQQGFNFVCLPLEKTRIPRTIPEAQFSLPYAAATALVKRKVFLDDFTEGEIGNPRVLQVAQRVDCLVDPELDKRYPASVTPAVVEVRTQKGKVFSRRVVERRGSPTNPLTMEEIEEKFRQCARFARNPLPEDRLGDVLHFLREMENQKDVTLILPLFSPEIT
ncbi:MAG: MmgE/PrpD family protein [Syntrophaceae bacterium]|nr:MmgE/PrpD family protein [Syntrophaceae bacterium]